MSGILIAPSVLSADFGNLARDVHQAEAGGADWIHVDVMDGHFVPNITIGPGVTRALRVATDLPLDVHLMIEAPERSIAAFADAGADRITVHQEACPHLHRVVGSIARAGCAPGVAVNPATPVESLREILPYVDLVLVMTVNPGFGGQSFISSMSRKIGETHRLIREVAPDREILIQVDGGIDPQTASQVVVEGATVLVAGSAVFRAAGGPERSIPEIRAAAERSREDARTPTETRHDR